MKFVRLILWLGLLCVVCHMFESAYLQGGYRQVSFLAVTTIAFYFLLQRLSRLARFSAVVDMAKQIRQILLRLYAYNGSLPDGKFPIHLRAFTISGILLYANQLVDNDKFWADLGDCRVGYETPLYVEKACAATDAERSQSGEELRRLMIGILERVNVRKPKPASEPGPHQ